MVDVIELLNHIDGQWVSGGGAKRSGYGPKEQGEAAWECFTHTAPVYLRGGRP